MIRSIKACLFFVLILGLAPPAFALEPEQILIVANSDIEQSLEIARYYSSKRKVPAENILSLPLGVSLNDTITRNDYEKLLVEPIREKLSSDKFAGKIRCLLTTYGVPIKVGKRGQLEDQQEKLTQLQKQAKKLESTIKQSEQTNSAKQNKKIKYELKQLQSHIDNIVGKETNASVDSELSMVLFDDYELYRWQSNKLKFMLQFQYWDFKTLMVCRLDGPGFAIAKGLVDKALAAEKAGLNGIAYFDSRGKADNEKFYSPGYYDRSLRDLAFITKLRTKLAVKQERTEKLFRPGSCPQAAIYCGWYSVKKYIDAFDFVDGAIGYHIASWEAVDLRDPASSQWCPAMLVDGITATLGAVAEPYLHAFPLPKDFFSELFDGRCLVEAYYRTKPFNSWQMVLIGDPLYKPFN